jgi:hypothetical protein
VDAGPDVTIFEGELFASSGFFSDPGADSWIGTVDYGDGSGSQSLSLNSDKTFSLNHTYPAAGVYNVIVTVTDDDGGASDPDSMTVTVQTPKGATEVIIGDVETLITTGVLNRGQGNALTVKLEAAIQKLEQGNTNAAINQLQAFLNQVNGLSNQGVPLPEAGQPLIDAASEIIAVLGG